MGAESPSRTALSMAASTRRLLTPVCARVKDGAGRRGAAEPIDGDQVQPTEVLGRVHVGRPSDAAGGPQHRELDGIRIESVEPKQLGCREMADPASTVQREQSGVQCALPRVRGAGNGKHRRRQWLKPPRGLRSLLGSR